MMLLAQATESGLDIAKILGVGGPSGLAVALLVYLGRFWLLKRREDREGSKGERENESQIVATTDALTKLVREQMVAMGAQNQALQLQIDDMRSKHEREIEKLQERISVLEAENESLRRSKG